MKYDWEDEAKMLLTQNIEFHAPPCFCIGLAVWNADTGEASLLRLDALDGVDAADAWKDVWGDAAEIYSEAVKEMYEAKSD